MSLVVPSINELFILRCTSYDESNPEKKWNNLQEIVCLNGTDIEGLQGIATAYGNFISLMSQITTFTEKVTVSTFMPDTNPYNANEFFVQPIGLPGGRAISSGDQLPLSVSLYLSKNVLTGHRGKLFVRGMLKESDVVFGGPLFALNNVGSMQVLVNAALTDSAFGLYVGQEASGLTACMASYRSGVTTIRPITSFQVSGVRNVSLNHKYFTRS